MVHEVAHTFGNRRADVDPAHVARNVLAQAIAQFVARYEMGHSDTVQHRLEILRRAYAYLDLYTRLYGDKGQKSEADSA